MFKNVIVRTPCAAMVHGITGSPELGKPNYEKALLQHKAYIEAMEKCGVTVTVAQPDERFPDSCFVEDVAIVTDQGAVITNPGAASRNREVDLILPVLKRFYQDNNIYYIKAPGTLDGGDVMMVENHFYVGLSDRTNEEGAHQLIKFLEDFGYTGSVMRVEGLLHLKTGMTYIGENRLLVSKRFADSPELVKFEKIVVDYDEEYCANCINVNGKLIVPAGYPNTLKKLQTLGMEIILVEMSEYKKIDGGLTCLSLRF